VSADYGVQVAQVVDTFTIPSPPGAMIVATTRGHHPRRMISLRGWRGFGGYARAVR